MLHVFPWSVFEKYSDIPGDGGLCGKLSSLGFDGMELFTMFDPVDQYYRVPGITSVHLPYAIDWHSAWEGRTYDGISGDLRYFSFGDDRDSMVSNVRSMIKTASVVDPKYGVLHAGNTDMRQVLEKKHNSDDMKIIGDFSEMMNRVVSGFPGNEPPFKLAFENLWWEGLKLRSPAEWELLEKKLEFDNWGLTLDTGHLMNTCDGAFDEDSAIDEVMKIVDRYPKDMRDRICTMHLQLSTTAEFRDSIVPDHRHDGESWDDFCKRAYARAGEIDQHRSFKSDRVREIVDAIAPDYLNHELYGGLSGDRYGDLRTQRSHFRCGSSPYFL